MMAAAEEVLDAEVVAPNGADSEPDAEMVVAPVAPTTLFRTDDPVEVLERATAVANALAPVLEERKLFALIRGKKHILVEGWMTLGAMLGVTPVCVWTRPLDGGWEARVEARTLDGRVIGAAEAECLKAEGGPWGGADYARRSMAQTRATSKALGSVLRFVVTLAGYSGTPAEEMPSNAGNTPPAEPPPEPPPVSPLDPKRVNAMGKAFIALQIPYAEIDLMLGSHGIDGLRAKSTKALKQRLSSLTPEQADKLEAELEKMAAENG